MHFTSSIKALACLSATAVLATTTTTPPPLTSGAAVVTTTITTLGSTLSGSLTVYGCATIVANPQFQWVLADGNLAGMDRNGTMALDGLVVANGTPSGSYPCKQTSSTTSSASSSATASAPTSTTTSKPPNEGERTLGYPQVLGWAGILLGAAAYVNA